MEEILENIDACIITHVHPDHFTKEFLPKNLLYIVKDKKDEKKLHKMGFYNTKRFETDKIVFEGVQLTKTAGKHGKNGICSALMGKVCGMIFEHPQEKKLYLAGDTIWYSEIEKCLQTQKPEYIILNACDARIKFLGRLIMNINDIVNVRRTLPKATIIISHMDSVNHAFLTRKDIRKFIDKSQHKKILVPKDGETLVY